MNRSDIERVRDILDCVEAIGRAELTVQGYPSDVDVGRVALDAVHLRLFMVREAVTALSLEIREEHPAVPWSDMARLADLIDSHVDRLDPQIVQETIGEPVRRLRAACLAILAESVRVGEDEP